MLLLAQADPQLKTLIILRAPCLIFSQGKLSPPPLADTAHLAAWLLPDQVSSMTSMVLGHLRRGLYLTRGLPEASESSSRHVTLMPISELELDDCTQSFNLGTPRVKRASVQPRAAPCLATSRISSMRMKARCPATGGCAKVQYPHLSLHSRVSGRNTCTQT